MYTGNIPIIILLDRQINFFPSVTVIRVEIFPINESCSEIHCFHMVKKLPSGDELAFPLRLDSFPPYGTIRPTIKSSKEAMNTFPPYVPAITLDTEKERP
jgi:hypothetical protein